jgi:hypothetical protein
MIKNFIRVQLIERFRLSLIKISRVLNKNNTTSVDFKKKKFLFNTQYIWTYSELEFMCAAQLQSEGHEVIIIICDGLPYSEREISDLPNIKSYKSCSNRTIRYCNAYGLKYLKISSFLNAEEKNQAHELSLKNISELSNLTKNNINLGDYAKRNHSHYFKGDVKPEGSFELIYRQAFESAYLIETSISNLLSEYKDYDLVTANGKFIQTGIPVELTKNIGNSFYTYEVFRQGDCVLLDKNRCSLEQRMDDIWDNLKTTALNEQQKKKLYHSFDLQQKSTSLIEPLWDDSRIDADDEIISLLGIDTNKKVIACYPNVYWDSVHMGMKSVSKDLTSWLVDMINFAKFNQDFQVIIRTHPAELKVAEIIQSKFTISDSLHEVFEVMPSNVIIIEPKSNVSSYSLARIADANLLWNGTMGLELALRGIKPVVIADAYYANKGFTLDFLAFEDLESYLINMQGKPSVSESEKRLLEVFCYHNRFKRRFNAPFYKGSWSYMYNYSHIKLGRNKVLDNMSGFLLDKNSCMEIGKFDFE